MNQYELYIRNNPDLLANWNNNVSKNSNMTIEQYGQQHYTQSGQAEGRQLPAAGSAPASSAPVAPANTTPANPSTGLGGIVPETTATAPAVNGIAPPDLPGANFNQTQTGVMGTAQNSVGTTDTAKNEVTGGTQNTAGTNQSAQTTGQTGLTKTAGTTAGTSAQNIDQTQNINDVTKGVSTNVGTGTNVSGVNDTLGFGKLLKDSATGVQASDAQRSAFLADVMKSGGNNGSVLDAQVKDAIAKGQSGPGMTGAGDSALARQQAYAANMAARGNTDLRLRAAEQAAGPTGLSTLSSAANPYLGKTENTNTNNIGTTNNTTTGTNRTVGANTGSTTGSTTGTQSTDQTGFSNLLGSNTSNAIQTGFSNLLAKTNEASNATAAGSNIQRAAGVAPGGQKQSGGGSYACTALADRGMLNRALIKRAVNHRLRLGTSELALIGYGVYGPLLAKCILRSKLFARVFRPVSRLVIYEECRQDHSRLPQRMDATFIHTLFLDVSTVIGWVSGRKSPYIQDAEVLAMLRRNNLCWEGKL